MHKNKHDENKTITLGDERANSNSTNTITSSTATATVQINLHGVNNNRQGHEHLVVNTYNKNEKNEKNEIKGTNHKIDINPILNDYSNRRLHVKNEEKVVIPNSLIHKKVVSTGIITGIGIGNLVRPISSKYDPVRSKTPGGIINSGSRRDILSNNQNSNSNVNNNIQ